MPSLAHRIILILPSFLSISLAYTSSGTSSSTPSTIVPTSPSLILHTNTTTNTTTNVSITDDPLSLTNVSTSSMETLSINETTVDDSSQHISISLLDEKDEPQIIVQEASDDIDIEIEIEETTSDNTDTVITTNTNTNTNTNIAPKNLDKENDADIHQNSTMMTESNNVMEDENLNTVVTMILDPDETITNETNTNNESNDLDATFHIHALENPIDLVDESTSMNAFSLNETASYTNMNETNSITAIDLHLPEDEASNNQSNELLKDDETISNLNTTTIVEDKPMITIDASTPKKKRRRKKRKASSTTSTTDDTTESNDSSTILSNDSSNSISETTEHEDTKVINSIDAIPMRNTTMPGLDDDIPSPQEPSSTAVAFNTENTPTMDDLINASKQDDEQSILARADRVSMEEQNTESNTMKRMKRKAKKSKRSKRKSTTRTNGIEDVQENQSVESKKRKRTKKRKKSFNTIPLQQEQSDTSKPFMDDDSDDEDFTDLLNLPDSEKKKLSIDMDDESMEEDLNDLSLNDLFEHSDDEEQNDTHQNTMTQSMEATDIEPDTTMEKSTQSQIDSNISNGIRVSVVTWNLAETAPDPSDAAFLRHLVKNPKYNQRNIDTQSPDIVLIGGQECENTKPRRSEGHRSRLFRSLAIKNLGRDYVPLAIHSLGGVQCLLFCHRRLHPYVDLVNVADVACGVGNVFHNKGAVGVYVQVRPREGGQAVKMLFIAAHLAAHVKNVQARNDDFWRILTELEMKSPPRFLPPKTRLEVSDRRKREEGRGDLSSGADISMGDDTGHGGRYLLDSMDHIFFCGDLNYRVDLPREYTEHTLQEGNKDTNNKNQELLMYDQLLSVISRRNAFPDFHEGKITFAPTFKFDKGTKTYDTSYKQRIPAWTDRILFKQRSSSNGKANGFGVKVLQYDCAGEATHSDHRPVFGTYLIGMGNENREGAQEEETPKRKKRRNKRKKKGSASKNDELD